MVKKNKLEQVLEHLVAGNETKAKDILHKLFIEKARSIHESLIDEENMEEASGDYKQIIHDFFELGSEDELANFVKAASSTGIMTDALTDAEWDMINNALPPGTDFWEWEEEQTDPFNGQDIISAVEQLIGQKTLVSKIHNLADHYNIDIEDMMRRPEIANRLGFDDGDVDDELEDEDDYELDEADSLDMDDADMDIDDADMGGDTMSNIENTMGDLESALEQLKAEFEKLESESGDMADADMDMDDAEMDMDDADMDMDNADMDMNDAEDEENEMFTDEDFDDLAEAIELEKVSIPTSGEVGAGKYSPHDANERSKSPLPPSQTQRFGAAPIRTGKGPTASGYERPAQLPSQKTKILPKDNRRKTEFTDTENEQKGNYGAKEDSRSALDTTDRTFGKGNQTSPLTRAPRK